MERGSTVWATTKGVGVFTKMYIEQEEERDRDGEEARHQKV